MQAPSDTSSANGRRTPSTEGADIFDRTSNERRLLALLQKAGAMPVVEIARRLALSAQAVSVMTRKLEVDGLIAREDAIRGKVGKPQTPFRLAADGAYSVGLRIGRRSADIVLLDLAGRAIDHGRTDYPFPEPSAIDRFAEDMVNRLTRRLPLGHGRRVAGIGIGAPFELWNWLGDTSAQKSGLDAWRAFSFERAFSEWTDLAVLVGNDASLACQGEAIFGAGRGQQNFGYFFVGSFIGGGVCLNGRLFTGATGNAGAFGSLPVRSRDGRWGQLLEFASIHQLELALEARSGGLSSTIHAGGQWNGIEDLLSPWIAETASYIAHSAMSVVASFDVPLIILDGSFPPAIRDRLAAAVEQELASVDRRGVHLPRLAVGRLGAKAGALGAAFEPIIDRLLM